MYKQFLASIPSTLTRLGGLSILLTTMTLGLNSPLLNNQASAMPPEPIEKPKPDPTPKLAQQDPRTRTPVWIQKSLVKGTIEGNITSTDSRAQSIPCNQITITFQESIPSKPEPNTFPTPTIKEISKALATGETLSSGCKYSISDGNLKITNNTTPYGDIKFTISAFSPTTGRSGAGFGASSEFSKNIPSSLDFSLQYTPGPTIPR